MRTYVVVTKRHQTQQAFYQVTARNKREASRLYRKAQCEFLDSEEPKTIREYVTDIVATADLVAGRTRLTRRDGVAKTHPRSGSVTFDARLRRC
jgi:hypothetical protein